MTRLAPLALLAAALAAAPAYAAPAAAPASDARPAPARPEALGATRLSAAEQRMAATVAAERERTIAFLARMVDQNSGTHHPAGVAAVADIVRSELEPLGFTVEIVPQDATKRGPHLVARHKGKPGRQRLLLIGHLDTVFEPSSPFQRWRREGDWGHGPGAGDDKGGIAVIVAALRAMRASGTLGGSAITLVLTGDEEDPGEPIAAARALLLDEAGKADVALDFEGLSVDGGKDMGVVARRGMQSWTLTSSATPAHSSGVGSAATGWGATYELVRILDRFRRELGEDKLTYNVGLLGGGQAVALDAEGARLEASGKTNITGATAVARGDLRALTPEQLGRAMARMRAITAESLPGARSDIRFDEGAPPMAPTAGNRALLARLNAINAALGLPAQAELDPLKRGAGDINYVAHAIDGLVGLGPASEGDHSDRERVNLPSIERQAARAAILMSRLAALRSRPR